MKQAIKETSIYPVVLRVPFKERQLKGKAKVTVLSRLARRSLEISAQKSNILLKDLLKDKDGVPLPFNGNYWSLTHKSNYVGGVVASSRIGIDIEKIRPVTKGLFKKTADEKEWRLAEAEPVQLFFRYWTSKEAVLKAASSGLKGLSQCRVIRVIDHHNLVVDYLGESWRVEHVFFDEHVASIVKTAHHIRWTLVEENGHQTMIWGGFHNSAPVEPPDNSV